MLHEEVDAVLFERDGEGSLVGNALDDFDVFDIDLVTGGGAAVGTDLASDDDARFEGEIFECLEDLFGNGGLGDDALDGSGAVAEDGEEQLAGGAQVVEPAAQGDGLTFVGGEGGDGGYGRSGCAHFSLPFPSVRLRVTRGRGNGGALVAVPGSIEEIVAGDCCESHPSR